MGFFWRIFPWLLAIAEFGLIIFILVNWVGPSSKEADTTQVSTPSPTTTSSSAIIEEKPATESTFKSGDSVTVSINTNLRDKPGGELIQTISKEETLDLVDGPFSAKGSWWWKTKVASTSATKADQLLGLTGYISEGYWLKKKVSGP